MDDPTSSSQDLHRRPEIREHGLSALLCPNSSPLELIGLELLRLKPEEKVTHTRIGKESILIVLTGQCDFLVGNDHHMDLGGRNSVFDGLTHGLYLAPGDTVEIIAETNTEIAIATAPTDRTDLVTQLIYPGDIIQKEFGAEHGQRSVHTILSLDFPADKLILGETIVPPGSWSCTPPYRDQTDRLEKAMFFRLEPEDGFALQRIYDDTTDLDTVYTLEHNDIMMIPRGHHPVVAGPGYQLYYLWVLAGDDRDTIALENPAHSWMNGD